MVREYDYRSGGWGFISPKVLLDESFQLNIELMSSSGIHKDIIRFRGQFNSARPWWPSGYAWDLES